MSENPVNLRENSCEIQFDFAELGSLSVDIWMQALLVDFILMHLLQKTSQMYGPIEA
jgi:hypothetical protein